MSKLLYNVSKISGGKCPLPPWLRACGVVGCCEVEEHSSSLLFSRKAILDVLCQQGDLIYGRPPVLEARRLLWGQWVGDCFDMSVDESLEDLKGTHSRDIGR